MQILLRGATGVVETGLAVGNELGMVLTAADGEGVWLMLVVLLVVVLVVTAGVLGLAARLRGGNSKGFDADLCCMIKEGL